MKLMCGHLIVCVCTFSVDETNWGGMIVCTFYASFGHGISIAYIILSNHNLHMASYMYKSTAHLWFVGSNQSIIQWSIEVFLYVLCIRQIECMFCYARKLFCIVIDDQRYGIVFLQINDNLSICMCACRLLLSIVCICANGFLHSWLMRCLAILINSLQLLCRSVLWFITLEIK